MLLEPGDVMSVSLVTDRCELISPEEAQALVEGQTDVPLQVVSAWGRGSSEVPQDSSYVTLCNGGIVLKVDTSPEGCAAMLARQAALFRTSYPYRPAD